MSRNSIAELSEEIISHIKAGEVIERPSSIVKELIENSIDAESDDIEVGIREGGKNNILVRDNGIGIPSDDVCRAFLRHSTSKINDLDDIYNIKSYGFRGEALASIGICSFCSMSTRAEKEEHGIKVVYDFGVLKSREIIPFNRGTAVEVSHIFQKIPARRKFLKSVYREKASIFSVFNSLSIPNFKISFRLTADGKIVFFYKKTKSLPERIQQVLDIDQDNLIYESFSKDGLSMSLFLPKESSANNRLSGSFIYVNNRYVKVPLIMYIMKDLLATVYTKNQKPFYILCLYMNPNMIDVNAHPQKLEIRLENSSSVISFIKEAFFKLFQKHYSISCDLLKTESHPDSYKNNYDHSIGSADNTVSFETKFSDSCNEPYNESDFSNAMSVPVPYDKESEQGILANRDLRIIGQVFNSYIIAELDETLLMIDQHALYEEYRFEILMDFYNSSEPAKIGLISPLILHIGQENTEHIIQNQNLFERLGFNISRFSGKSIVIREIPSLLKDGNLALIINEILNSLREGEGFGGDTNPKIKDTIAKIACHSSLRANFALTQDHQQFLISIFNTIKRPKCPHNRPIYFELRRKEIESMFRRRS